MAQGILEAFRQSGDSHVGQTLVRLARLAQARHQYEAAQDIAHRVHGGALQPGLRHGLDASDASARTEVDR